MKHIEHLTNHIYEAIAEAALDDRNIQNPEKNFSRNRIFSFSETFKTVLHMGGNTLDLELLNHFKWKYVPSSSAFVQARAKILPRAFKQVFHSFSTSLPVVNRYRNYRLIAVDGTSVNIYRNPMDAETYIPNKTHKGHNALHVNALYDVLNHSYLDAVIEPFNTRDERGSLIDMMANIPEKSIIIADRGYEGYNLFAHIEKINSHYLFRVKDINSNGILKGFKLPNEEFDIDLTVNVSNYQRKELRSYENYRFSPSISRFDFSTPDKPVHTLSFRVVRIKLKTGKYESIITNLPNEFSKEEIEKLYFLRWGIETSFRQLKYAVGLSHLHAKKKNSVIQEIYARLIMYNLCQSTILSKVLPKKTKSNAYKINFTMSVHICRKFLRSEITVLQVEAYINKYLTLVRPDRVFKRNMKIKKFTSFTYRVA